MVQGKYSLEVFLGSIPWKYSLEGSLWSIQLVPVIIVLAHELMAHIQEPIIPVQSAILLTGSEKIETFPAPKLSAPAFLFTFTFIDIEH